MGPDSGPALVCFYFNFQPMGKLNTSLQVLASVLIPTELFTRSALHNLLFNLLKPSALFHYSCRLGQSLKPSEQDKSTFPLTKAIFSCLLITSHQKHILLSFYTLHVNCFSSSLKYLLQC